ncbi:MAG: polysaccharide pyruvyl transferase family protein [bacterium]|nr:polysaccharide pyruvyl transferase family protein [bacterium]
MSKKDKMVRKPKLNVMCFGYNGVNNTGSEAKLFTTLMDLKEVFGPRLGQVTIMTQSIDQQRRYTPDPAYKLIEVGPATVFSPAQWFNMRDTDILVLSEGSTFIDHFSPLFMGMFCFAAIAAKARGHQVVAYANDCGHLKPSSQKLLKYTMNNKVDLIMLRNPDAKKRMQEYGVTVPITVTADGAYEYPTPPPEHKAKVLKRLNLDPARKKIVGIAPKEFFWWPIKPRLYGDKSDLYKWPFYQSWTPEARESSRKYVDETARYADWVVDNYDADIAMIAMEHMDSPPAVQIFEKMKHKDRVHMVHSDENTVDDIVCVLSSLWFQVTTRYHTTVLASPFGIPMISVSSDTRCEAVFRELGIMDLYIDYVGHPERVPRIKDLYGTLTDMTKKLVGREKDLRQKAVEMHPKFHERARMNVKLLKEWLEKNFPV